MKKPSIVLATLLAACAADPPETETAEEQISSAGAAAGVGILDFTREQLSGDLYHHTFVLGLGTSPNAQLRVHRVVRERAPWVPRAFGRATMLLHGDFSTFVNNFVPSLISADAPAGDGLAVYLASRNIDVWGIDRRWTSASAEATPEELADLADMGFAAAIDDTRVALLFARSLRLLGGAGWNRMILSGFSRGAHLAYAYVADEAQRPASGRHVRAVAPIDAYAVIDPDEPELRQNACTRRDDAQAALDAGMPGSDDGFFVLLGTLARTAPDDPSPILEGATNREALLPILAQTALFFTPTPAYHLAAGEFADELPVGLRHSSEGLMADWFAAAAPFQSQAELADSEALWCGEAPLPSPLADDLADVTIPLFYLGAEGGFGTYGLYTTGLVASSDVEAHIVEDDFGHADLLYADGARELAWAPLADWMLAH